LFLSICRVAIFQLAFANVDYWNLERPKDMANIASLEVMCGKSYMEVQISFDKAFNGIIFSKGAIDQYNCIYVKPQTGSFSYTFNIFYEQCGTKPDMNGKFYENNIVIQYDKDLIEVWDEAKRLRCEWYNDYEKGITKPPIRVSDLEVVELNFRGDNVDCWMEIQHGKGPWASLVNGIVPLGTTLTMVIGITDKQGEFDMRVKSCIAEAENSQPIKLTDENGCVLRPKMISKFMKIAGADDRASVVTYAFFHAFKFPDSMSVNIKCKVEICRFGCPEHCQRPLGFSKHEQEVSASLNLPKYRPGPRFEAQKREEVQNTEKNIASKPRKSSRIVRNSPVSLLKYLEQDKQSNFFNLKFPKLPELSTLLTNKLGIKESDIKKDSLKVENVPLHRESIREQHLVQAPASNNLNANGRKNGNFPIGPRKLTVTEKKRVKKSAEMGVYSEYKVVSEADLDFKPRFERGVGVTVFQGQMISEEVVYGICLPATQMSIVFLVVSIFTVIAVLMAGFLCYKRHFKNRKERSSPLHNNFLKISIAKTNLNN